MAYFSIHPTRNGLAVLPAAVALSALWLDMTDANVGALIIGLPCLVLAVVVLHGLGGGVRLPRMGAALALAPSFLAQSIQGAFEIATRAFGLQSLPSPRSIRWPLALPYGRGRVLFMNMVSLIPGTLSVRDDGECLQVHVLDGASAPEQSLAELQRRVADLSVERDEDVERA